MPFVGHLGHQFEPGLFIAGYCMTTGWAKQPAAQQKAPCLL
jgi:hypothetical protein